MQSLFHLFLAWKVDINIESFFTQKKLGYFNKDEIQAHLIHFVFSSSQHIYIHKNRNTTEYFIKQQFFKETHMRKFSETHTFELNYKITFYFTRLNCLSEKSIRNIINAQLAHNWQIKSCPLQFIQTQ